MNDQSCDAACAINSEITPINSIHHQDVTPLTNNKSSDNDDRDIPADERFLQSAGDQNSSNICVNLDDSKFSSQQVAAPIAATMTTDEFNREFGTGRNSPFDANEGMLAHRRHIPTTKKRQKPVLNVADAWKYGVTHNNDTENFTFVYAELHCDTCGVHNAIPRIVIGDSAYVKFMLYGEEYFAFEFILSFVYLVAHLSHIESSYAEPPFLQVITYQSQRLVKDDVITVSRAYKKIVGVFHSGCHYAIAEVDPWNSRTITIYDGLFYDLSEWQKNVVLLLKKCNLIDFETERIDLVPDPKSKLIIPGYRRGKELVNGYTIIINNVKWRLIRGTFIVQTDGFNCVPIACLKVMELFSRIDRARAVDCYKKARIRKVVFEEWDYMVRISDKHGSLTVKDT